MQPTERDRERFRDAARQHLTWCDFNRTGIDGDYKDAETRYLFKMWWSVERERQLLQNLNMSQGCKLSELLARAEKAESELDAERKRLDWALEHEVCFYQWGGVWRLCFNPISGPCEDDIDTTNPRSTIDELIAGDVK